MTEKLAKVIARSGISSRREAEQLIINNQVKVNGELQNNPATRVSAEDKISVNGKEILDKKPLTRIWILNKPQGFITSANDDRGRDTIYRLIPKPFAKIMPIGRLDFNTEGLLLLTNDGGLKRYIELPATGWKRVYRVKVFGEVTQTKLDKLKTGVRIRDPKTGEFVTYGKIDAVIEKTSESGKIFWLRMIITEGKNREIRNICESLGLQVSKLERVEYGPFSLGNIHKRAFYEVPREFVAKIVREMLKSNKKV
jgi:23S rRNA pseudouridine2605 synthase